MQLDIALVIASASVLSHDMHARCSAQLWDVRLGMAHNRRRTNHMPEYLTSERNEDNGVYIGVPATFLGREGEQEAARITLSSSC